MTSNDTSAAEAMREAIATQLELQHTWITNVAAANIARATPAPSAPEHDSRMQAKIDAADLRIIELRKAMNELRNRLHCGMGAHDAIVMIEDAFQADTVAATTNKEPENG